MGVRRIPRWCGQMGLGSLVWCLLWSASAWAGLEPEFWVHDNTGQLFTVDWTTGETQLRATTSVVFNDIAFDPQGHLFGVDGLGNPSLYRIDSTSGAVRYVGPVGQAGVLTSLVFDTQGTLWAGGLQNVLTIDPASGQGTVFTSTGPYQAAGDMAFSKAGLLYMTTAQGDLVRIDIADRSIQRVGAIPDKDVYCFGRAPDGTMVGIDSNNRLLSLDLTTGLATQTGRLTAGFNLGVAYGGSFLAEAVPEPATILLLGVGLAALVRGRFVNRAG